ncbi:MAG: GNAT family N-acetyltransferase [Actinomycetota bacterium]
MSDTAALEAASYATWTADEADVVDGWHVTATAGLSRRVNSARDMGDAVVSSKSLAALRSWFDERQIAFVVRETPLMTFDTSHAVRDQWGFGPLDETTVMSGPVWPARIGDARICPTDDPDFHSELASLNGRTGADVETLARLLDRVADRSAGVWIPGVGGAVVVQDEGRAAVFSLAVDRGYHRRGVATQLMGAASNWADSQDVSELFVQVVGTNSPALGLYASLGFTEEYRYRYLQPVGSGPPE